MRILYFLLLVQLTSCTVVNSVSRTIDPFDKKAKLTRKDIRDAIFKDQKEEDEKKSEALKKEAPIPNISKLIVAPPPPAIGGDKTISFSVTDQIPLKDVLIELGRVAKIDIDIDPSISGGIIINAKNRPLKEVIDRIANLANLRYTYEKGILHFERDSPYLKNYLVDYITDGSLWTDVQTNVTAIMSTQEFTPSGGDSDSSSSSSLSKSSFSSNKSAGIISVFATEKQHSAIKEYLSEVEKTASAQVLIEAKVVEVNLNDEYKTGINWSSSAGKGGIKFINGYTGADSTNVVGTTASVSGPVDAVITKVFGTNINADVSALEKFGTTRTLSSPRVHAINNQKATLDFTDKLVYFKVDQAQSATGAASTTGSNIVTSTITSTKQEEKVGVSLDITPSINTKTGDITMKIKPIISVVSSYVTDPASPKGLTDVNSKPIFNNVPVVQTRTIETIAKIQSGNVIVIGGLMKENTVNTDTGVPFLSSIPILGWLFKSVSKTSDVTETVIFIKATILSSTTQASKYDRNFQDKFDTSKNRIFDN